MAQPTDWVSAPVMSPLDTVMWRADADRRLRSSFCALEILDRLPDWDRLVAAHDWATRMVPRFRQRVVDSPLGVGAPSWAIDEDFDLH
jgi:diacylglycerol O-acyltransferase / wax synthase